MPALPPAPVPAICERPGFPCGLKVLVVENDLVLPSERLAESIALLKEASYDAESLASSEAVMRLERNQGEFDVLLVAVRPERWLLHALDEDFNCGSHSAYFRTLAASLPVLLLSESFETKSLCSAIEGGAIHSLRLPLDRRQVQKVWQQCVRKHVMSLRSEGASDRMQRSRSDASTAAASNPRNDAAVGSAPSRKRESHVADEVIRRPVRQRTAKVTSNRWGSGVMAPRASASQAAAAPALPQMAPPCQPHLALSCPISGLGSSAASHLGGAPADLPWALLGDSTDALLSLLPPSASCAAGGAPHDPAVPLLSSADALDALLPWDGSFLAGNSFPAHLDAAACGAPAPAALALGKPPAVFAPPPREATPSLVSASPSSVYSLEGFTLFTGDSADSLRGAQGPLGLRLRKSPSLANLVEERLSRGPQPEAFDFAA